MNIREAGLAIIRAATSSSAFTSGMRKRAARRRVLISSEGVDQRKKSWLETVRRTDWTASEFSPAASCRPAARWAFSPAASELCNRRSAATRQSPVSDGLSAASHSVKLVRGRSLRRCQLCIQRFRSGRESGPAALGRPCGPRHSTVQRFLMFENARSSATRLRLHFGVLRR